MNITNRIIIRTLFGDVENNERLRTMVDITLENENTFIKDNSSLQPITYFVLGDKNEAYLKKRNIKNIIKISSNPDARPHLYQEMPFYYNKTYLANEAIKMLGKNPEMVLLDMDARVLKWPDERMWELYGLKKDNIAHFQGVIRCGYKHDQRIPITPADENIQGVERNMLITTCATYCNDKSMWEEYLNTFIELYLRLKNNPWNYWYTKRGHIGIPIENWHDEHVLFYWFDKKFGIKTTPQIIEMVEQHSIIKLAQSPPEARAIKNQTELYFRHKG